MQPCVRGAESAYVQTHQRPFSTVHSDTIRGVVAATSAEPEQDNRPDRLTAERVRGRSVPTWHRCRTVSCRRLALVSNPADELIDPKFGEREGVGLLTGHRGTVTSNSRFSALCSSRIHLVRTVLTRRSDSADSAKNAVDGAASHSGQPRRQCRTATRARFGR